MVGFEKALVAVKVIKDRIQYRSQSLLKATITRCDLSPRFFCIDVMSLCEFESDKI